MAYLDTKIRAKSTFLVFFLCKIHGMDGEDGDVGAGANRDMGEMGQGDSARAQCERRAVLISEDREQWEGMV